jgi:hypothetical protein
MATFKPQNASEHFALQRTTNAAKLEDAVYEARAKGTEINRRANERFYNSLALFSGGTVALSVTYLGYLKTLSKPIQHPRWLMLSWVALIVCVACSLFWAFVYGYYSHYARAREYVEAVKEKYETEAAEIVNLRRNVINLQSQAQLDAFRNPRLEAALESGKNARYLARREKFYQHVWRWLGRIAHVAFLVGLTLLLAFAIRNM